MVRNAIIKKDSENKIKGRKSPMVFVIIPRKIKFLDVANKNENPVVQTLKNRLFSTSKSNLASFTI